MSAEIWSVFTTGVVILIAIAVSNRSLRREFNERIAAVRQELIERINAVESRLGERIDAVESRLGKRIDELSERIGTVEDLAGGHHSLLNGLSKRLDELTGRIANVEIRVSEALERLGRVEGLLEGLGLTWRKRSGKRGGEGSSPPALPSP